MPPDFFGMTTTGLAHGDVECWMRPATKEFVQNRVHFLGGRRIDSVGPELDGRTVRRNRNLEGNQGAGSEVC